MEDIIKKSRESSYINEIKYGEISGAKKRT